MPKPGRLATQGASPREAQVAEVLLGCTSHLSPESSILLIDDVERHMRDALTARGFQALSSWSRYAFENHCGTPWPEPGAHDVVLMRLPRSKDVLEMNLHVAASRLAPGGQLLACGANDEGAKSAQKRIAAVFSGAHTADTRKHCRVIGGTWKEAITPKDHLGAWHTELPSPLPNLTRPWHHYPGLFAKGKLDAATELLLDAIPKPAVGARVLDFAAGGGVIAAALLAREPSLDVTMLDADAIALHAARQNVPRAAHAICSDAWHQLTPHTQAFDLIVSNPPIHRGKIEDFTALRALAHQGRQQLAPGGELWMVVQRQVPVSQLLEEWKSVSIAHHDNRFNVWKASY
jgi:16S rRNA (guanine1207-N2)-methyltransferase